MLFPVQENIISALQMFLDLLKVKVSSKTIKNTLRRHPDYPSLLSVSDALGEWQVRNIATRVSGDKLHDLPTPFFTFLRIEQGVFAVVREISQGLVHWFHTEKGWIKESQENFFRKWDGTVLLAETDLQSGEKEYSQNTREEKSRRFVGLLKGIGIFILFLSISIIYFQSIGFAKDWHLFILWFVKFLGIVLSSLLLWREIDKNNPLLKRICQINRHTDCGDILDSKAARLTAWLGWSELGFFYFAGTCLYLILGVAHSDTFRFLSLLSITALPVTLYSVIYQGLVIRKWCVLCMIVQVLLWMEMIVGLANLKGLYLSFPNISLFVLSFGLPILIWAFLKPLLDQAQKMTSLDSELLSFKRNPELFLHLLHQQKRMPPILDKMETITLGNPRAENILTIVTNPFCKPCAQIHQEIQEMIPYTRHISFQCIFAVSPQKNDPGKNFVQHLLSLAPDLRAEALEVWYSGDARPEYVNNWAKKMGDYLDNIQAENQVLLHSHWCMSAQVHGTPALFWNGYRLPEAYHLSDLKYLSKYLSQYAVTEIIH